MAADRRVAFFIFDPTLGDGIRDEDEAAYAKIIYYTPSYGEQEEKRMQASLVEGLIGFTAAFTGGKPLQTIRTRKLCVSALQAEPDTWMVLVMKNKLRPGGKDADPAKHQYDEGEPADSTLQAVLQNCYNVFRLLHGRIKTYLKDHTRKHLCDLLEDFVPAYLDTVEHTDMGIFHEISGFHYGPADRHTCLSIHCFLGKVQEEFPKVRHSALLYNAHLLYSGFRLDDFNVLYSYLVAWNGAVSNQKLTSQPFGRIPTAAAQPGGGSSSFGRAIFDDSRDGYSYLLGCPHGDAGRSVFVPTIYLADGGVGKLVVLTHRGVMLILMFEDTELDIPALERLRAFCSKGSDDGLGLSELHRILAEQFHRVGEQLDDYRFIYYNHSNHALRLSNQNSTGRRSVRGSSAPATLRSGLTPDQRTALCPLRAALADPRLRCREVSLKSEGSGWVCAKRWREREFYLLLGAPGAGLSKCQEECARFASIHFSNIFMM